MFNIKRRAPGIGLHIGSKYAALSIVKRSGNVIKALDCGSIPLSGAYEGSLLDDDPEALGRRLANLVKEMNCRGRGVVAAAPASQIYLRNITLPWMKAKDLRTAAYFEAMTFLPVPVEEAAFDVFPVREFHDGEVKKVELFFVAARRQTVRNLDVTCQTAGLRLMAVELETTAIGRLLDEHVDSQVFLYIGDQYSIFCVLRYGAVVFQHYFPWGGDSLESECETSQGRDSCHTERLIAETAKSLEFYSLQRGGPDIDLITICGRGTIMNGLDNLLSNAFNKKFVARSWHSGLEISPAYEHRLSQTSGCDYSISLGLAARRVI